MNSEKLPDVAAEEEPSGVRGIDLLYSVFFIGVLLTFAIYVSVTMLLGAQTSVADKYLTGKEYQMPLSSYNDAYYKSNSVQALITQYDYLLFGKVEDKNILVGREKFLFEVVREENYYNYLRDYIGEAAFSEESMESIYYFLSMRQAAYHNQGAEYMVVVIPSAQTVYDEYLPSYIQRAAGETRLMQLSDYLKSKEDINFIDLTDALIAAKSYGMLYNNTEDSLNSLGQYFVYQALYKAFPEQIRAGTEMIEFEDVTLYTHHTDGKELARAAGLASFVQNETVSLSSSMEFNYLLQELYPAVEITYADRNRGGTTAGETILLEFSNEWDKIQLMPYFSTTFDDVVYKSDHRFDLRVAESAQPTLVIQFVHEYELNSLTNSDIAKTYNEGLTEGENPFITASPIVTGRLWLDDQTVCLTGTVEANSELTVSGDEMGTRSVNMTFDEDRFIILIQIGNEKEAVIRLQATAPDKNRSRVTKVTLVRGEEPIVERNSVMVGEDSRLFRTTLPHTTSPDTGTLSVLKSEIQSFTDHVMERTWRKQTQFINVVIPRASSVYAESAPEELQGMLAQAAEYREKVNDLYEACGWTVIDLTEDLRENRDIGKLYGLTSEQWTDYGAYIGYRSLITRVEQDYPQIEFSALSDYTRITQVTAGGELATLLGFEEGEITETLSHLHLYNPKVSYEQRGNSEVDMTGAFTTMVADSTLPIAIVIRDSLGTEMLESMAQHFRLMIVLPEGETEISDDMMLLFEPDYVIRLADEAASGLYDLEG